MMCKHAQKSVGAGGGRYVYEGEFAKVQELIHSKLDVDCISYMY